MARSPAVAAGAAASIAAALALALAAAVSLGLARFSYALLLPPMRADLGWSYLTAGAMNTANAAGYLAGALLLPRLLSRLGARQVLLAGGFGAAGLLALHGFAQGSGSLYGLRFLTGVSSAASFVAGGVMAARLASGAAGRSGLVLGLYYGGTGLGIVLSALLVPPLAALQRPHAWQWAWLGLAVAALLATLLTRLGTRSLPTPPASPGQRQEFAWGRFGFGLAGYLMFGLGYIGYMTFVVTLLREQGQPRSFVTGFYALLGLGVIGSSWLWAGLLQRCRGGQVMALLNGLLALATLLPVLSRHPVLLAASGLLFGAAFLSVVASTTALVRHNLPPPLWPAGISAFTIVFAAGQIVGPSLVGWVSDGTGGLELGFLCSAALLASGAALALRQKPL